MSKASSPPYVTRPAGLLVRLCALLYDLIAVLAIVMVVGMACEIATRGTLIRTGPHTVVPWWYPLLQYLVVAAYFVISWQRGGQTLGMRPWRMVLRTGDEQPVSWQTACLRAALMSLPLLLLCLPRLGWADVATTLACMGGLWALFHLSIPFDPRRRALQDRLVGTRIIRRLPPKRVRRRA